ncbi:hypothetical protein [Methylobacterium radiodurans]|nr:hypothetical protein [Methylobacterium radiodurans]
MTIPTAAAGVAAPLCTVGQPCTFAAPVFACDYAGAEKIALAGPATGSEIGAGLVREKSCQTVTAGRPLATETTNSGLIVYLTEVGQHLGYMPVGVFAPAATVASPKADREVPLRVTTRLADFTVSAGRAPFARAVSLTGQMAEAAVGIFRAGPAERRDFCSSYAGSEPAALRSCLSDFPDYEVQGRANCTTRVVTVRDRTYRLFARPTTFPSDSHLDASRRWIWRNVASDEWLDGSVVSGEDTVDSTFDALCPGRRPDAERGLVYRDPQATYPSELRGRWFDNQRACADPGRIAEDYEDHSVMVISERERSGNRQFEFPQRINAVRRLGPQAWQIAGSHRIDVQDVPEIFGTATYTLTRDGLLLAQEGETSKWVKCR